MRNFFIIISVLLSMISCDYGDGKLILENSGTDTLFFTVSGEKEIERSSQPIFYRSDPFNKYWSEGCLLPGESKSVNAINKTWEEYIEQTPDKKLRIVFFEKKLLDSIQWEVIVDKQLYSKLIECSVSDLNFNSWTVKYMNYEKK